MCLRIGDLNTGLMYYFIVLNANICNINCTVVMCYFIVLNANVW